MRPRCSAPAAIYAHVSIYHHCTAIIFYLNQMYNRTSTTRVALRVHACSVVYIHHIARQTTLCRVLRLHKNVYFQIREVGRGPLVTLPTLTYRARPLVRRRPCHRTRDKKTAACPSLGRSFWPWYVVHRCHQ